MVFPLKMVIFHTYANVLPEGHPVPLAQVLELYAPGSLHETLGAWPCWEKWVHPRDFKGFVNKIMGKLIYVFLVGGILQYFRGSLVSRKNMIS